MESFRQRSVENVISELIEIDEKFDSVLIVDDCFLANTKRADMIMDKIAECGIDLDFYVLGTRVDKANRNTYKKMKKAGVKLLTFGIESGNQDVLNFYDKRITLDQIRKAVNLADEMNFTTIANFMFGAPIETENHIKNTFKFACSLPLDLVFFSVLTYSYRSDLWFEAVNNGIIDEKDRYLVLPGSRIGLGEFTSEELFEFCNNAFKSYYARPNYFFRRMIKSFKNRNFSILKLLIKNIVN
jgi:radical SAM superfamily enzyme YgiQ (UPF0313 family)